MDNLTHGLFGLAVGALRRTDARAGERLSPTDKAVLWTSALAAELPDLDSFWPAGNEVLGALQAHRGPTHSLLLAPVVALVAAAAVKAVYRGARFGPMFGFGCLSVVFAHLAADAWTGWGTRLLWPFTSARLSWDWTMVVDPLVTLPLLAGAAWAWRRRDRWRRAVLVGAAVACAYVAARASVRWALLERVEDAYPAAERVEVFPSWLNPLRWRYVAVLPETYLAGEVSITGAPAEEAAHPRPQATLPAAVGDDETVREALAWARMPLLEHAPLPEGGHQVRVADLRYHLRGRPTLAFSFDFAADGALVASRFERGGSAAELFDRWRKR